MRIRFLLPHDSSGLSPVRSPHWPTIPRVGEYVELYGVGRTLRVHSVKYQALTDFEVVVELVNQTEYKE